MSWVGREHRAISLQKVNATRTASGTGKRYTDAVEQLCEALRSSAFSRASGARLILRLIVTILATIGAVVVIAIVVVLVMYYLLVRRVRNRVRQSLREFEDLNVGSIDEAIAREGDSAGELCFEVPPMRIHLREASHEIWEADAAVLEATCWIRAKGFEFISDYLIDEAPEARLRVFLSEDQILVATIRQDSQDVVPYVEFCFDLGDNRRGGVSNPPHSTVALPPDAIGEHFHDDFYDGVHILEKMLARARELAEEHGARRVDFDAMRAFFETAHAHEMDARIERGGLTIDEIRSTLEHSRQAVSPAEIEEIQWTWQDAIDRFLVDQSRKRFDDADEWLAVHDGSLSTYLYDRLSKYYSEVLRIDSEEFARVSQELKTLLELFQPREAIARFRPLLPSEIRINLVDQLRKPVEADLYWLPASE